MEGIQARSKARKEETTPDKRVNGHVHFEEAETLRDLDTEENIFIFWPNLIGECE